ncbi:CDP-glucose 4,6-dehydratase [Limibaculum sp. M0105]|uniref:CDP-glucose 4,6-dehydratase n=1 Tax=Thermohalobaculum xanthum TaxID=2753746 RepID=A0A8J7M5U5_9RHOB|nr:CDP-glucose 4,6-dehydratase [Thermohalobaculum xanthum]MBK0398909.1 CDP-glucose 4,6-dehydratase [Thermohalobaculum xanthum]
MSRLPDPAFWAGKRVLLTGQTGFKGSWAALWLAQLGAEVHGLAQLPETEPNHFDLAGIGSEMDNRIADLCVPEEVEDAVIAAKPDIVLHMAAQALVRRSLREPVETWKTNVSGTANLLFALRAHAPEATVLVVTSDKVYRNDDTGRPFTENDPLGGKDPYSASKAACEILVGSWRASFPGAPLATVRAGNVIGGGDFSENRIVPDIVRAVRDGEEVILRHPEATRPWQHVLDCLCGYFLHLEALAAGQDLPALNIGPSPEGVTTVAEAAETISGLLGGAGWRHEPVPGSVEARMLALDSTLARRSLGWSDWLPGRAGLEWTAEWYRAWLKDKAMAAVSRAQIEAYMSDTAETCD